MPRAAGIAVGATAAALLVPPGLPPASAALCVAAMIVAAWSLSRAMATDRGLPLAMALGATAIVVRLALAPAAPGVAPDLPDGDGPWTATVASVSAPRDGAQRATLHLDAPDLRVAATLPRFPAIEPGFRVSVAGAIQPPPDGDGYGDYLRRIGVAGTLRSRTLEVTGRGEGWTDLERWRRTAADALSRSIPEPQAGLAAGILVGLRDRVDRDLAADFTTVGASHVVAISGWNIAIVAASVAAIGGSLGQRRRSMLTVGAIVAYVAFVGPTPSVVRAAAMAGVVLLARETGRAGRATSALGWAAALILLIDPAMVRDAGFQLSTLATGGLIAWGTPVGVAIDRMTHGRLPRWVVESLGVSFAAQAATLPVVLASFGRLALISPLVNLVVVPAVAPAMAAGAVALAAGFAAVAGVPSGVATIAGLPAWALLGWVIGWVRAGTQVPFASVELPPPLDAVAAASMGLALAAIATRGRLIPAVASLGRAIPERDALRASATRLHKAVAVALVAAAVALGLAVVHRPDGRTTISVLDVGQGDAILLEGPDGGRLLVDGGPDPDRLLVALDERVPPWDRRLDAVVLTHPHEDHVAGLARVIERYQVSRVFEPGMRGPGPGYRAWSDALARRGVRTGSLAAGDRLEVDDVVLDVLWPEPGSVPEQPSDTGTGINNVSIVLLGEADGRRFLLAGDVEKEVDPLLVARGLPPLDILKVAHHGSRTASTDVFLDAVRPALAVVSAGPDNPYGHPSPDTIARLEATGGRVLRTDTNGSVSITIRAGVVRVSTSGPRTAAPAVGAPAVALATPASAFSCRIPAVLPTRLARDPPLPSGR